MDKCPTCKKPVPRQDNPFLPFCSERCKLIDLGKWVSEEYRVPGRSVPPESQEEEAEQDSDSNGSEFNL